MKKMLLATAFTTVALLAGKDVIPAVSEPAPVVDSAPATTLPNLTQRDYLTSHGLGLKVGTLGVGVDFEHFFNKKHALRINPNYLKITRDDEDIEGINYDAELKLQNAGLIYDYHPWGTAFRVSTGIYYNGNKLTATARPQNLGEEIFDIGGQEYKFEGNAEIDAKVDFKKVAPYVGIGWSSAEKNGWHIIADIGVMYVGSPKVSYNINKNSGTIYQKDNNGNWNPIADIENNQEIKTAIDKEAAEIKDEMKDYKWWPVLTIGIQKKF
jgi:hypothetical protein